MNISRPVSNGQTTPWHDAYQARATAWISIHRQRAAAQTEHHGSSKRMMPPSSTKGLRSSSIEGNCIQRARFICKIQFPQNIPAPLLEFSPTSSPDAFQCGGSTVQGTSEQVPGSRGLDHRFPGVGAILKHLVTHSVQLLHQLIVTFPHTDKPSITADMRLLRSYP